MAVHPRLAHRGGLEIKTGALLPPSELFKSLGGRPGIERLVEELYGRLLADPQLRGMFPPHFGGSLVSEKAFFEEWFGGAPLYAQKYATRGLVQIHHETHISKQDAARWLGHFRDALNAIGAARPLQEKLLKVLQPLALGLTNQAQPSANAKKRCVQDRNFDTLTLRAQSGKIKEVALAIEKRPEYLSQRGRGQQTLLYCAAGRGRNEVVRALLVAGADPNQASCTAWAGPLHTPLAHALLKGHTETAAMLRKYGARDDIFTFAAIGDLAGLQRELELAPELANASDPAHDIYQLTPLHHAVAAGQCEAARFLFEHGARVNRHSAPLARWAAAHQDLELLELVLKNGADATTIGPGEWVLHPQLANLLQAHGADVNYAERPFASWIWLALSGNQGKRDRPELTQALLEHGARVNETRHWGKGPLHFAAKAGFVESMKLLLAHKADPNLRDATGATPLFYAFQAGKSIDPLPVLKLLLKAGADPEIEDAKGRRVHDLYPKAAALLKKARR